MVEWLINLTVIQMANILNKYLVPYGKYWVQNILISLRLSIAFFLFRTKFFIIDRSYIRLGLEAFMFNIAEFFLWTQHRWPLYIDFICSWWFLCILMSLIGNDKVNICFSSWHSSCSLRCHEREDLEDSSKTKRKQKPSLIHLALRGTVGEHRLLSFILQMQGSLQMLWIVSQVFCLLPQYVFHFYWCQPSTWKPPITR